MQYMTWSGQDRDFLRVFFFRENENLFIVETSISSFRQRGETKWYESKSQWKENLDQSW